MRLRNAASVLLTLVYCTAGADVPRWSKAERDLAQGEWVPVNNERPNRDSARIPSAINPQNYNQALQHNPQANPFPQEYRPKQIVGPESAPQRIAFLHPQSVNPQPLAQSQVPPQVLPQFLTHEIGQPDLTEINGALLRKQPVLNPNYYPQQENYNFDPNYSNLQGFRNAQYNFGPNAEYENTYSEPEKQSEIPLQSQLKTLQSNLENLEYRNNFSLSDPKKKEEVQILYVPVEMLRQQEQARKAGKNLPLPHTGLPNDGREGKVGQQLNTKESQKFRHPIQPLRDQTPAHHLRDSLPPPTDVINRDNVDVQNKFRKPSYSNQRPTIPPKNEYYPKYQSNISGNKEQYVDESSVQDEISDYRNTVTRRTPPKDSLTPSTLPPPNQPPLSVFMESTNNNRISDVLSLLKDSKTIPVLDSVGSDAPQVFVGPSNLNTPFGYIKYELPYLSSFHSSAPQKLSQVPFFVAPLNFQPPPGFAKIPFPPPHIGSVVLSNATNKHIKDEVNIPTPGSVERHTPSYNDAFTIPADISSISPQLPSLINSLQEDEYIGASSTESLSEPTQEPTVKYRRPTSRRQNNRGSQRGYDSGTTSTTTRRPVSRQRRPSSRYNNQRINQNTESKPNLPEEQYSDNTQNNYNTNKQSDAFTTPEAPVYQTTKNYEYQSPEPVRNTHHFPINNGQEKEEQTPLISSQESFNNPSTLHGYSNEEFLYKNDHKTDSVYHQGRTHNLEQPIANYQDTKTFDALNHEAHAQNNNFRSNIPDKSFVNYESQQQHSQQPTINIEEPSYLGGLHSQTRAQDSTGSLNTNDELRYRNIYKENTEAPQEIPKHNLNYRPQEHHTAVQQGIQNPSLLKTFTDQNRFQVDDRSNYNPPVTTDKQQIDGYFESFDTNSPAPNVHLDTPDNYGGSLVTNKPTYQANTFPSTTSRTNNENDHVEDKINYELKEDQHKTERPVPIRTRNRFRSRSQSQHTTPSHSSQDEDEQKVTRPHQNEEVSQYRTETAQYTSTEQVPVTQNRKYLHRGRRPLRPTHSTTASPATTTSAPPGTKYLIRTRRPTTAPTKLPGGRGRIRRPTTPTTTTAQPTTTTEYPRTLSFQYQQPPFNEDYNSNDQLSPAHEPVEYRGHPQYQDGRTRQQIPPNNQDISYQHRRNHHKTASEQSPNYNFETEEENIPTKKQYKPTDVQQYSGFERTQTPLISQEYETTTKASHYREYERASKPYVPREYEATPKSYSQKDYEETQKPHYVREYEATLKPRYSKDYETTPKPVYTRDYVETQKPQFSREYESTMKINTYNQYDTSQAIQNHRHSEPVQDSQQFSEYETTVKPQYENEYIPTHKSQHSRHHTATVTQSNQEYETTPKQYFNQRTQSSTGTRAHNNQRRRPPAVSRGEKPSRYNKPESSTPTATTKDNTADYWNQGVTIQQSQSYVYNPEENQEQSEGKSKVKVNPQSNSDYDDFYGFQEGGQYSSDQSPFPSNDQHVVTYTKHKLNQEIGKANQYPEKPSLNKNISDENNEDDLAEKNSNYDPEYQENISAGLDDQSTWNDSKSKTESSHNQPEASDVNQPAALDDELPVTPDDERPVTPDDERPVALDDEQPVASVDEQPVASIIKKPAASDDDQSAEPVDVPSPGLTEEHPRFPSNHKKNGKRRGTWVRVRVKKPKDVFETAESQRFSSVRENALITDTAKTITFGFVSSKNLNSSKPNRDSNEQIEVTTYNVQTAPSEDGKPNSTSSELSSNAENLDVTTVSTIPNIQEENTTTTTSPAAQENTTQTPETFRTSTTTEISLETEICYKGQCIKTKRKKDNRDRDITISI